MSDRFLSERMSRIKPSGIRKMFDLTRTMEDPIDFSMGQPDFDVPEEVKDAMIQAVREGRNGYSPTTGIPPLHDRLQEMLSQEFDWNPSLIVTCGVAGGLVLATMATLSPGDEMLVSDPCFVQYIPQAEMTGARAVPVSLYDDFQAHPERWEQAITPRTKVMLINSPSNPTGVLFSDDEIREMCEIARKHDLVIISDEIYYPLVYDGEPVSPAKYAPERTIVIRGFGKSHGMTGWRMGYAAGPEEIISAMTRLQHYSFVCGPHPAQWACLKALDVDVTPFREAYRRKRDIVVEVLGDAFEFGKPGGGFFVFCKVPSRYSNSLEFIKAAIEKNVVVVPGEAFSSRDTHFRISYAVQDDRLRRGCELLSSIA